MSEKTNRDFAAEARAALEKLRAYAGGHSADITAAIDKLGDVIDKGTGGKYAGKIDHAQETAKKKVTETLHRTTTAPRPAEATDPGKGDGEGEPQWKQPPGSERARAADASAARAPGPDVAAALARLRAFAAGHADEVSGLVDQVGAVVDRQTRGKYADKIRHAQAAARSAIGKIK